MQTKKNADYQHFQTFLKILRCENRKIIKGCLAIFQHYAWKG